jgi:adenine-specific DNA-methyltransferase
MTRLTKAGRVDMTGTNLSYRRLLYDFAAFPLTNVWTDITGIQSRADPKVYVVQTATRTVERCISMTTDPGDLVLDPTCGSGTTAYVAEQWGRRWITVDTSRVALALARARIMGARYPYYLLADSREGQLKEAEVTRTAPSSQPTHGDIGHGFVYERVPHITLKSIANNAEIDVIWEKWQETLEPLRVALNEELGRSWQEWEIPHHAEDPWSSTDQELFYSLKFECDRGLEANARKLADLLHALNQNLGRSFSLEDLPERPADPWPEPSRTLHAEWWGARIARQKEIDASIAAKADFEYLYDRPYTDNRKVRVAGPFTVESLSPHRVLGVDENDELIDAFKENGVGYGEKQTFPQMILENLKTAGVQQAHKEDRITFTSLTPWPGDLVCAEGHYLEGDADSAAEKRAAIFIGPEFGTVSRPDLVLAAREAGDGGFDVLIACAFNYEAHATEFSKLGRIPVLKARMNADLHMADDLKNTGKGNLFVIFGEPDISILPAEGDQIRVKVNGVDVFHPSTGEVRSDGPDGIACWFVDTDYNEESFFVRQAYFLGANDPYKALKTTLKAEIDEDAWATLNSDTSRPFDKPTSGRIAVKVINHLGDEVMKVFRV